MALPGLLHAATAPVRGWGEIIKAGGGLLERGYNAARDNMTSHPIYGNVGPTGLMQELKQDPVFGGPGGQAHTPQGEAAMARTQMPFEERVPNIASGLEAGAASVKANVDKAKPVVDAAMNSLITPEMTLADLHEVQVAAQRKTMMEANKTTAAQTRAKLEAEGASEEQLRGWDKFTSEYDLATIGMALLATNDGSGDLWASIGKSLMLGKQAKIEEEDRELSRYDTMLEQYYKASKDAREQSQLVITAADKESQIGRRADQTAIDQANLGLSEERNAISRADLLRKQLKDNAEANGGKFVDANKTSLALAAQEASKRGIKLGEFEDMDEEQVTNILGGMINSIMQNDPGASWQSATTVAFDEFMKQYSNTASFGQDWERLVPR